MIACLVFNDLLARFFGHYLPITTVGVIIFFFVVLVFIPAWFSAWPWLIAVVILVLMDVLYASWKAS